MKEENEVSDQSMDCNKKEIVHQTVEVQAQVTVTPLVEHGIPRVYCIDSDIKKNCNCDHCNSLRESRRNGDRCTFTLSQVICVEIPITIGVDVDVDQGISCCSKPNFGPCKHPCKDTEDIY